MTSQGENGEDRPIVRGESETETRITCPSLHPKKIKREREREREARITCSSLHQNLGSP